MKKQILNYIKIALLLVLFLQAGKGMAQTVTITASGLPTNYTSTWGAVNCGNISSLVDGVTPMYSNGATITATASSPVNSMSFYVATIGGALNNNPNDYETHVFDVQGTTSEVLSIDPSCTGKFTISGNTITNTLQGHGATKVTVSSATPFTTVKIDKAPTTIYVCYVANFAEFTVCNAGSTAPSLTATTLANVCPSTKVNLNSLLSSSATAAQAMMLKWYTDAAHTTPVADATQAAAGTYYAFYYDSVANCYSPATGPVTATVAACCPTTSPTVN